MGLFCRCRGGRRLGRDAKRLLLPLNQRHNRAYAASTFLWLMDSKVEEIEEKKTAALFLNAKIMFMFISTKGLMSEATLECFMYWDTLCT